jgi:hypothetical protein
MPTRKPWRPVSDNWRAFLQAAYNCGEYDLPEQQRIALKQAFYGGAVALYSALNTAIVSPDDKESIEDLQRMRDLNAEMEEFAERTRRHAEYGEPI